MYFWSEKMFPRYNIHGSVLSEVKSSTTQERVTRPYRVKPKTHLRKLKTQLLCIYFANKLFFPKNITTTRFSFI